MTHYFPSKGPPKGPHGESLKPDPPPAPPSKTASGQPIKQRAMLTRHAAIYLTLDALDVNRTLDDILAAYTRVLHEYLIPAVTPRPNPAMTERAVATDPISQVFGYLIANKCGLVSYMAMGTWPYIDTLAAHLRQELSSGNTQ